MTHKVNYPLRLKCPQVIILITFQTKQEIFTEAYISRPLPQFHEPLGRQPSQVCNYKLSGYTSSLIYKSPLSPVLHHYSTVTSLSKSHALHFLFNGCDPQSKLTCPGERFLTGHCVCCALDGVKDVPQTTCVFRCYYKCRLLIDSKQRKMCNEHKDKRGKLKQ